MKPELLLGVKRGNITERTHFGFIEIVDINENIVLKYGDSASVPYFLRSAQKPFQALPVLTSGAYEAFNLSLSELAIISASHGGTKEHTRIVSDVLKKAGLDESFLKSAPHYPLDSGEKEFMQKNNLKPSHIHSNCSGKHAGFLAVCAHKGWNLSSYLDFDSPIQKEVLEITKKYCNTGDIIEFSLDGCGAPVHGMSMRKMGAGLLRLFNDEKASLIKEAFIKYPYLIGGEGRPESIMMDISKGRIIAKTGAEGLLAIINTVENLALMIKILDGSNHARNITAFDCLKKLGWLTESELSSDKALKFMDHEVKTLDGQVVGGFEKFFSL